jgi:deoxyribonuclease-4
MDETLALLEKCIGGERMGSLHLNDSQATLGSNRDRHANIGRGELGESGCAAFLSAPSLAGLPCVLETPGEGRSGASGSEVARAVALLERGIAARG